MMSESSQSAFKLLNDLLTWARSESGIMEMHPQAIEIRNCVEEEFQLLRILSDEKSIRLHNECREEDQIWGDREMTQIVCRNLLSNAIKFTGHDGAIHIRSRGKGDFIEIRVQDSGVGMTQDEVDHLFSGKPVNSKDGTNQEPGSGLGLRLVKDFVIRNRGTIRVESRVGDGTTFVIELPAAPLV